MNYDFHDVITPVTDGLESGNQMVFNGVNLDKELTTSDVEFVTLNINGRGLANYTSNVVDIPGLDGGLYKGAYLETRTLEVEVQLEAVNTDLFISAFEKLNKIFRTVGEVPIQFTDEPDITYYGRFVSGNQPKEDSNSQVFTMTFVCSDPFKEMATQTINYTNASTMTVNSDYPVKPYLEIIFPEVTNEFKVHNTTQDLTIDYKKVDGLNTKAYHLEIDDNRIHRSSNETDGYNGLVISSDWEDFTIETGDQIVIQPEPERIRVHYKGVKL